MADQSNCPGLLFVWTNIDPLYEADFNKWYDREHVEERIAIEGFTVGARYIASRAPRKYLGLYRTENLGVFTSPAYSKAFAHQTPWSVANFGRMSDAMRRVCAITAESGIGAGSWLAIVRLGRRPAGADLATLADLGRTVATRDGVIATRLLEPDAGLRQQRIESYLTFVRAAAPQDPSQPVLAPGDKERQTRIERERDGIPLDDETWSQIVAAAKAHGVDAESF